MMKRFVFAALVLFALAAPAHAQTKWGATHTPSANVQATVTKAAISDTIHVADCVVGTFVAGAAAPAAVTVVLVLRDGATSVGTPLATWAMSLPATAGASASPVQMCGLNIAGTKGNAMTLEFTVAGGANTLETVYINGQERKQ